MLEIGIILVLGVFVGFTVFAHAMVGLFALYRMARRTAALDEDRVSYTDTVIMTQTVLDIDTLAEEPEEGAEDAPQADHAVDPEGGR